MFSSDDAKQSIKEISGLNSIFLGSMRCWEVGKTRITFGIEKLVD